jgi:hypothetical protein
MLKRSKLLLVANYNLPHFFYYCWHGAIFSLASLLKMLKLFFGLFKGIHVWFSWKKAPTPPDCSMCYRIFLFLYNKNQGTTTCAKKTMAWDVLIQIKTPTSKLFVTLAVFKGCSPQTSSLLKAYNRDKARFTCDKVCSYTVPNLASFNSHNI